MSEQRYLLLGAKSPFPRSKVPVCYDHRLNTFCRWGVMK